MRSIMLAIGMMVLSATALRADLSWMRPYAFLGITAGYNGSMHTGIIADNPLMHPPPKLGAEWEHGFHVGLCYEREFSFQGLSILGHITFDRRPGRYSGGGRFLALNEDGRAVETVVTHRGTASYDLISADVMLKVPLARPLSSMGLALMAGPSVGYMIGGDYRETIELSPGESGLRLPTAVQQSEQETPVRVMGEGDIPDERRLRVGLRAGVSWEIRDGLYRLAPMVMVDYGLTDLSGSKGWKVHAVQVGLDYRLNISEFLRRKLGIGPQDDPL